MKPAHDPLSTIPHDDLIAEVQRRLDLGLFGWHGLMSTHQANARDNWRLSLRPSITAATATRAR